MNVVIIQGHPDAAGGHFCNALADAYAGGAAAGGHAVRRVEVAELDFPLLRTKQDFDGAPPPSALVAAQEAIAWAGHLVIVYPLWLGGMPALLKGFFEQTARPGFAFEVKAGGRWVPALRGKSARVIVTMGMPALVYRWYFRAHGLKSLERNILAFVGIKPTRATLIGSVEALSPERRAAGSRRPPRSAEPRVDQPAGKNNGRAFLRHAAVLAAAFASHCCSRAATARLRATPASSPERGGRIRSSLRWAARPKRSRRRCRATCFSSRRCAATSCVRSTTGGYFRRPFANPFELNSATAASNE